MGWDEIFLFNKMQVNIRGTSGAFQNFPLDICSCMEDYVINSWHFAGEKGRTGCPCNLYYEPSNPKHQRLFFGANNFATEAARQEI